MKAFGTKLEATVRILAYDNDGFFPYEEIGGIRQLKDKGIDFSLLIYLKQKKLIDTGYIQVAFIHICNDRYSFPQRIRRIPVGILNLGEHSNQNSMPPSNPLHNDPWPIRQTFRWNLADVPTEGPGTYAIVLSAPSEENPKKQKILDCAYLEVT